MAGYRNRTITLEFDELSEDPATDRIFVSIKNPQLQSPEAMRPRDVPLGPDGKPLSSEDAMVSMYEIISKLVVKWRVYDATAADVDDNGVPVDQPLMPQITREAPCTPAMVKALPMEIVQAISKHMKVSANPQ